MNELFKKGIDKDLASETTKKLFQNFDSTELAIKSAEKKLKTISHKPEEKQKQLLISHLQRNGFDWDTTKQTVDRILS